MPTYEYDCSCGHRFELLRPMAEHQHSAICPECDKWSPRVMSAEFSFEGNGAGFYNNLYQGHPIKGKAMNTKKEVWDKKFPEDKSTN